MNYLETYIIEVLVAVTSSILAYLYWHKIKRKICLCRHGNKNLTFSISPYQKHKFTNTNPHSEYTIEVSISIRCFPVRLAKANVWVEKHKNGEKHEIKNAKIRYDSRAPEIGNFKRLIGIPNTIENRDFLKNSKLYVELVDTEGKRYPCEEFFVPKI